MEMEHDPPTVPHPEERVNFNRLLISAVKDKPALWNATHPDHTNSRQLALYWDEIAAQLKTNKNLVAVRWKNLRDSYRIKLHQINTSIREGAGSTVYVRWAHFEQLQFLKSHLSSRKTGGNMAESEFEDFVSDVACEVSDDLETAQNDETKHADDDGGSTGMPSVGDSTDLDVSQPSTSSVSNFRAIEIVQNPLPSVNKRSRPYRMSTPKKRRYCPYGSNEESAKTGNDHQLQACAAILRATQMESATNGVVSSDPDFLFLQSLLPYLKTTPPNLVSNLKLNMMYIAAKYSKGDVPTELLSLDV